MRHGRLGRLARGSIVGLLPLLLATPSVAQWVPVVAEPGEGRLTVRPHEMATGTQNPPAGKYGYPQTVAGSGSEGSDEEDEDKDYFVYVSPQCAGAHRCPLIVFLAGGGGGANQKEVYYVADGAAKYGAIVLAPNYKLGDIESVDAEITQVLRDFAIDPDKIGIGCASNGCPMGSLLGHTNMDVFSRIALISPAGVRTGTGPANPATQFFLSGGVAEGPFLNGPMAVARWARYKGQAVTQAIVQREHWPFPDDYALMWQWLRASWAAPGAAPPAAPRTITADSLSLLTPETLTRLTTFWARVKEPDSLRRLATGRTAANAAYLKEISVPVGAHQATTVLVDLAALAAHYPAIAAALKEAGLTAPQAEALLLAVTSTKATAMAVSNPLADVNPEAKESPPPPSSVLGQNVAFLAARPDLFKALDETYLWLVSLVDR